MNRRLVLLVLGALTVVALLAAVFPTRTWLSQREAIAAEEARVAVLAKENARLAERVEELHTEAEVERLAREQYNMVRPGEEAYAILPAPQAPAAGEEQGADGAGADAAEGSAPATEPIASVRSGDDRSAVAKLLDALSFWN